LSIITCFKIEDVEINESSAGLNVNHQFKHYISGTSYSEPPVISLHICDIPKTKTAPHFL